MLRFIILKPSSALTHLCAFISITRENLSMNTKNEWEKQNTLRWILQIVKEARGCSLTCEVRICCRIILHQLSFFSINCEAFGKISTTFPSKLKRHLNQFLLSGEIIVCFAPLLPKGPFHRFISICYVVGLNSTAQKITRCHAGFGEWIGMHHWSVSLFCVYYFSFLPPWLFSW